MSSLQEVRTYLTSLAILGFLLPLAIIICSTVVLIIRCAEPAMSPRWTFFPLQAVCDLRAVLFILQPGGAGPGPRLRPLHGQSAGHVPPHAGHLPRKVAQIVTRLVLLLIFRFQLPTSQNEIGEYLTPELARALETLSGLAFPLILYATLPGETVNWNVAFTAVRKYLQPIEDSRRFRTKRIWNWMMTSMKGDFTIGRRANLLTA